MVSRNIQLVSKANIIKQVYLSQNIEKPIMILFALRYWIENFYGFIITCPKLETHCVFCVAKSSLYMFRMNMFVLYVGKIVAEQLPKTSDDFSHR